MNFTHSVEPLPTVRQISDQVALLRHPFPYKSMLAISSDCDGMSLRTFEELHRFINTKADTPWGEGLGLDVSDSMWVYAHTKPTTPIPDRLLSLKAGITPDAPEDMAPILAHYVQAGWIDTLHSIGGFGGKRGPLATTGHVEQSVRAFYRHKISLPVWVNHGNKNNIQNIGSRAWMLGGVPGSPVYMLPHLVDLGVRFINYHETPDQLVLPGISPLNLDEFAGWSFSRWYERRTANIPSTEGVRTLRNQGLPEESVFVWHVSSMYLQINAEILDRLVAARGFSILAQHMGHLQNLQEFPDSARSALTILREYHERHDVLVARSARLLEYMRVLSCCTIRQHLTDGGQLVIDIAAINDPGRGIEKPSLDRVHGLSFLVKGHSTALIAVAGRVVDSRFVQQHPLTDDSFAVTIRWHEQDLTDYTARRSV